jgi:hypothetical protein
MNASTEKTFAAKVANLVRRLGSDYDGEVVATRNVLRQFLASRGLTFTDLANDLEKLATGGLEEDAMKRVFDGAYAKGFADAELRRVEGEGAYGKRADGSPHWEAIALYCQREKERLGEDRHRQFVDDMASRMTWSSEPTEKQGKYLLSLFRQLGGRIK